MKEMWDQRYAINDYVYGTGPNGFFKSFIETLKPGRVFLPGEGEGRNGVYAATLGWDVVAQDYSETGRDKALALAHEHQVAIQYHVGDVLNGFTEAGSFDLVAIIFLHLPAPGRESFHREMTGLLKPGGYLLMEAFEKKQIGYKTGGPPNVDYLYRLEDIQSDFKVLKTITAIEETILLDSNLMHQGEGRVIQFVGRKKVMSDQYAAGTSNQECR